MAIDTHASAPLSPAQESLWLLHRMGPRSAAYNNVLAVRMSGPLDVSLLERCVHEVVARHEPLRTTFHLAETGPEQRVSASFRPPLHVVRPEPGVDAQAEAL